ncbi:MAG: dihydroxyacetone kinase subunit L [Spirochaetes bacterium]|nr:dihydroxyacetone kinase subunit L [Spirochaetota bacterium]
MNIEDLKGAVAAIATTMRDNRNYLVELDQRNGDGDLGITMADGYGAISAYLATCEEEDLGRALMKCSSIFNEKAPSTLGTITSLCLMAMAKSLKGKTEASVPELAAALEAGIARIEEKAKSKPGDKTILDARAPAAAALAANASAPRAAAFQAAALAAAAGSEATKAMRSVHGRAAYYGDKSIGVIDAGSVVGKLIFESLASCCAKKYAL